jgi:hypothetical protein
MANGVRWHGGRPYVAGLRAVGTGNIDLGAPVREGGDVGVHGTGFSGGMDGGTEAALGSYTTKPPSLSSQIGMRQGNLLGDNPLVVNPVNPRVPEVRPEDAVEQRPQPSPESNRMKMDMTAGKATAFFGPVAANMTNDPREWGPGKVGALDQQYYNASALQGYGDR